MDFKKPINSLLARDMDRREFLAHAGAATLAVIGVSGLIRALTDPNHAKKSNGYGSSAYGGGESSVRRPLIR